MKKSFVAALAIAGFLATPAVGQQVNSNPNGVWVDEWGTTFTFELCGDGTQLCGVLNDIQGESRTEENLAFVGQEVVQGELVDDDTWEGQIALDGGNAVATVEMIGPDTLAITGCRAAIFCATIEYQRAS